MLYILLYVVVVVVVVANDPIIAHVRVLFDENRFYQYYKAIYYYYGVRFNGGYCYAVRTYTNSKCTRARSNVYYNIGVRGRELFSGLM